MNEPINLHLTSPQLHKLRNNRPFQMAHAELLNAGKGHHSMGVHLTHKGHHQMIKNLNQKKGFRFAPEHIEGYGLWDSFKSAVHHGAEFMRNHIPQEHVVSGIKHAANAVGNRFGYQNAGDRAEPYITSGVKYAYGRRGKGIKGSPEMAEKMARLRAMRGANKKGGDLFDDARNTVNKARDFLGVGVVHTLPNGSNHLTTALPPPSLAILPAPVGKGLVQDARDFIGVGIEKGKGGSSSRALTRQMGLRPRHLIKGSPEAKAYMASIRGKKKKAEKGKGMWDWADPNKNGLNKSIERTNAAASQALDPNKNGLSASVQRTNEAAAKALDPNRNGVAAAFKMTTNQIQNVANSAVSQAANAFKPGGSAEDFGKQVASALIHQGIPEATAYLCSSLATAACPAGGPVVGWAASAAGKELGKVIAQKVGNATGYGVRLLQHPLYASRIHTVGGHLVKGIPSPIYTNKTIDRINTLGLMNHHKNQNGLYNGGSFLPLGSKGGSFVSP